ncbi:MAG: hypothetical protein WCI72_01025 [archaeon]
MGNALTRYRGDFVSCNWQIGKAGQRMATAREGMIDRIRKGFNSEYKEKGCWHPEGTARIGGITHWCLAEYAPTTRYAQKTLEANKAIEYLALTNDFRLGKHPIDLEIVQTAYLDARKPVEQRRVLIPLRQGNFAVASQDLGDVEIVRFLARDAKLARDYGKFLKNDCGIDNVSFCQLSGDQKIAAGLWLYGLDSNNSDFAGNNMYFETQGSAFGVFPEAVVEVEKPEVVMSNKEQLDIIEMLLKNRPKK